MDLVMALERLLADGEAGPVLLLAGIVALSFLLEDGAALAAGLLAAAGTLSPLAAFLALWAGIWIGDLGLYGLGWLAGHPASPLAGLARRRLGAERLAGGEAMLARNLVGAVMVARIVPGLRLATYTTAGFLRVSAARFAALTLVATGVWSALLFMAVWRLGEAALASPWLWIGFAVVAVLVWLGQRVVGRRLQRRQEARPALDAAEERQAA